MNLHTFFFSTCNKQKLIFRLLHVSTHCTLCIVVCFLSSSADLCISESVWLVVCFKKKMSSRMLCSSPLQFKSSNAEILWGLLLLPQVFFFFTFCPKASLLQNSWIASSEDKVLILQSFQFGHLSHNRLWMPMSYLWCSWKWLKTSQQLCIILTCTVLLACLPDITDSRHHSCFCPVSSS